MGKCKTIKDYGKFIRDKYFYKHINSTIWKVIVYIIDDEYLPSTAVLKNDFIQRGNRILL